MLWKWLPVGENTVGKGVHLLLVEPSVIVKHLLIDGARHPMYCVTSALQVALFVQGKVSFCCQIYIAPDKEMKER